MVCSSLQVLCSKVRSPRLRSTIWQFARSGAPIQCHYLTGLPPVALYISPNAKHPSMFALQGKLYIALPPKPAKQAQ